jgi:hypothetical protein
VTDRSTLFSASFRPPNHVESFRPFAGCQLEVFSSLSDEYMANKMTEDS